MSRRRRGGLQPVHGDGAAVVTHAERCKDAPMHRTGRCWATVALALLALAASVAPVVAAPAGTTLLVSRPDGLGAVPPAFDNGSETPAALSADGRYAAFESDADGFAPGTNPFFRNILLRDTQTDTTTLVSRSDGAAGLAANQDATNPAIAVAPANVMPDAPVAVPHVLVAFTSGAPDLVDHATGTAPAVPGQRIWLRDVTAGTTYLVSKADGAGGAPSNGFSDQASIDVGPAGPVVAFFSNATNLGNSGGIFLRTLKADDTELISCHGNDCSGTPTGANAFDPSVRVVPGVGGTLCSTAHPNGCVLVAFDTADASITNDPGGRSQIVVAVAEASTTGTAAPSGVFIASRPNGSGSGLGDGESTDPSLDSDGRAVAFISKAANLTGDTLPANPQEAYLRRLDGATTKLVSRADGAGGAPANSISRSVSLGGDVSDLRAAFETDNATSFGAAIGTNAWVRDDAASTTALLNRAAGPSGAPGDVGTGSAPAISEDGSSALFESSADNLGDGPAAFPRLHVRRLDSGALEMVSRPDGTATFASRTGASQVAQGAISDDGRYVAFSSTSALTPEIPGASPFGFQVFVRDLLSGRTILVSRASGADGALADATASDATISGDGRFVAFTSAAGNLTPDGTPGVVQAYVRDLVAQTTTLVSRANGPTGSPATSRVAAPTISRDGRVVVFDTGSALDPAGANGFFHVYERDLVAQTTTLVDRDDGAAGAVAAGDGVQQVPDADGSRVAWTSRASLAGAPADNHYHVYRRDLRSGSTVLVSRADGAAGASAAGDSGSLSIDADGNVVAFQSNAQNLGQTLINAQVFVRDVAGGRTQLVSRESGPAGAIASGGEFASLDAAGDRVAFSGDGILSDAGLAPTFEIFVRDLPSQTTTLASRADGAAGAMADGRSDFMAFNATGDCVAFGSPSTNLGDGFGSADFASVHLRVLRGACPIVAPAPPPPVIPIAGKARAAVLRLLAVKPRRFHVGGRGGGTKIAFTLDEAARVTLAFDRLTSGHKVRRRCVAKTKLKHTKRCTIAKRVGRLVVNGRKGRTTVEFGGKLGRRPLARGSYRLTATPAGGKARTLTFTVVAAPKPKHRARKR
jgi:Tol biopolymer transport system component